MLKLKSQWLALVSGVALLTGQVFAQDSGPLLDLLVRKGLVSDQEAEELRAELAREAHAGVTSSISGGKSTTSLAIDGRIQLQYAGLSSDQNIADTNQFFLRRFYLGARAKVGANWLAVLNYDFSGGNFDKGFIEWSGDVGGQPLTLDFGLRKVNFGFEETTSSGSLKAIERSAVTRFFTEPNNGRRLGGGAHRIGLFLDGGSSDARRGRATGFYYGAAITNPQRTETFGDGTVVGSKSAGDSIMNTQAFWGNAGYTLKGSAATVHFGGAIGFLPDQGGPGNLTRGQGYDMVTHSIFADLAMGKFNLAAEYLWAEVDSGAAIGTDAKPSGFWVQPSFMVNEKFELVARFSSVAADGRGVKTSDGIRSSPGATTAQKLEEYYLGFNYYIVATDVKLQLGYVGGRTKDAPVEEEISGVRSQLQIMF